MHQNERCFYCETLGKSYREMVRYHDTESFFRMAYARMRMHAVNVEMVLFFLRLFVCDILQR